MTTEFVSETSAEEESKYAVSVHITTRVSCLCCANWATNVREIETPMRPESQLSGFGG